MQTRKNSLRGFEKSLLPKSAISLDYKNQRSACIVARDLFLEIGLVERWLCTWRFNDNSDPMYKGDLLAIDERHAVVQGNGNVVYAGGCLVLGNGNLVFGPYCDVIGERNRVHWTCVPRGKYNMFLNAKQAEPYATYNVTYGGEHGPLPDPNVPVLGVHVFFFGDRVLQVNKITDFESRDIGNAILVYGSIDSKAIELAYRLPEELLYCDDSLVNVDQLFAESKQITLDWEPLMGLIKPRSADTLAEDEDKACIICLANKPATVLLPCGHICLCMACTAKYDKSRACPMCRAPINSTQRVFF